MVNNKHMIYTAHTHAHKEHVLSTQDKNDTWTTYYRQMINENTNDHNNKIQYRKCKEKSGNKN